MRTLFACMSAGWVCLVCAHTALAADAPTSSPHPGSHAAAPAAPHGMMMPAPAPLGVGRARVIKPGQLMLSYRYMRTQKNQLLDGHGKVSPSQVATLPNHFAGRPGQPATYRSSPQNMTMQVHMVAAQVGILDGFSAVIGVPYILKEREAVTFKGPAGTTELGTFKNKTSGFGDVAVSGLVKLYDDPVHHLHLMAGVSFPTGSITQEGVTLQPNGQTGQRRLAYGLQLGTGTFNLLPGLTYWGAYDRWTWGVQAAGQINLGRNDEGYTFGDSAFVTAWGSANWGYGVFTSVRLSQTYMGAIEGADPTIVGPSPTTDPNNYGGWKTLASFGLDYRVPEGPLKGVTPGVEVTVPLYQNLNGPQLSDAWTLFAGVRKVFTF